MNEQPSQPMSAFEIGRPDDVLAIARVTVEGAREVFSTAGKAASMGTDAWQQAALANYAAAQRIAEMQLKIVADNVDAAFSAARAMAGCKTVPEASAVYRDFVREQFAATAAQTKELGSLSTHLFQKAQEAARSIPERSLGL